MKMKYKLLKYKKSFNIPKKLFLVIKIFSFIRLNILYTIKNKIKSLKNIDITTILNSGYYCCGEMNIKKMYA